VTTNLKKKLKNRLATTWAEPAKVHVGKNGLSETLFKEISNQLELKDLVKIKFLQNFQTENFDADIKKICKKTSSTLVGKRGKVIIVYKGIKRN